MAARVHECAAAIEQQAETLKGLQATIATQDTTIYQLRYGRPTARAQESSVVMWEHYLLVKAPYISYFSVDGDCCNSLKVRSLIYDVRKTGFFTNLAEGQMGASAECRFTDEAAYWVMRLDDCATNPTYIARLQEAMMREFVSPDEGARPKIELMEFETKVHTDNPISKLRTLIEITGTAIKETYIFFFMTL